LSTQKIEIKSTRASPVTPGGIRDFAAEQADPVQVRILAFAGSLRQGSYNKLLLKSAAKVLSPFSQFEIYELDSIPLYNQDIETLAFPETVIAFKKRIEVADAVLISTPEYNHSYPGVLKNAIEWASRPYGQNSFDGKPTAVISASPGLFGGVRAQERLKQDLLAVNARLVTQPEVIVGVANQKFDGDGNLLDQIAQQFLRQLGTNMVNEAKRVSLFKQTFVAPALRPIISGTQRNRV